MRRRALLATGITALTAARTLSPAWAADDDAQRAERWDDLKHAVFGDRAVGDGTGMISLDAPSRALDAALVPVTITLPEGAGSGGRKVKAVWLLVDGNPSPLAGTFRFGPAADPRTLKTRVRVDQYTLVHAVAETEDGGLFATERFVKAAGGCSAPSSKDPQLAMSRMGKMRLRTESEGGRPGEAEMAQLLISHPNNNGMQMNQVTRNYIPARYIQEIMIHYGDALVLDIDTDISLSEDPAITFGFVPVGAGPMRVEVRDSTKAVFKQDFAVTRAS